MFRNRLVEETEPGGSYDLELGVKDLFQLRGTPLAQDASLDELRRSPWLNAMKGLFAWQQLQAIDREAPERIEVPSGSRIALQWKA